MKISMFVLACGLGLIVSGCATDRKAIVTHLPPPAYETRPAPRVTERHFAPPAAPRPRVEQVPRNWSPPGGVSNRWKTIVIHHSASQSGNARKFDSYHRNVNHWDELGYHFVIGNGTDSGDGEVEVGSRWVKQKHGAHCKTQNNYYNDHGIGICLVGDFRRSGPSPAQMRSLTRLVRFLTRQCRIGAEGIVSHGGVTGKTICPGPRFPMYALRSALMSNRGASYLP